MRRDSASGCSATAVGNEMLICMTMHYSWASFTTMRNVRFILWILIYAKQLIWGELGEKGPKWLCNIYFILSPLLSKCCQMANARLYLSQTHGVNLFVGPLSDFDDEGSIHNYPSLFFKTLSGKIMNKWLSWSTTPSRSLCWSHQQLEGQPKWKQPHAYIYGGL